MIRISFWTAVLLVVLRLAIGWHFLVEGWHKLETTWIGKTEGPRPNTPFTSAGYFTNGTGPLAKILRQQIGDPDEQMLALLDVQPIPPGQDPATAKPQMRMPPLLAQQWKDYVDRFAEHYQLDDRQKNDAIAKLVQTESQTVTWLTRDTVDKSTPEREKTLAGAPTVKVKESVPFRIQEYKKKLRELQEASETGNRLFNRDVGNARVSKLRAEVAGLRQEFQSDLDERSAELKKSLDGVLTPAQRKMDPVSETPTPNPVLSRINLLTRWGLTILGGCLLIGLFSRLSCLLSAGFLLMTYLCAPPWPWLPVPPPSEGHVVFVNKNLIEMLALLVLASTASGRWFGVDALIHQFLVALRGRPTVVAERPVRTVAATPTYSTKS